MSRSLRLLSRGKIDFIGAGAALTGLR